VRAKRARSSATKARYIELMCQWLALANQIELEEKAEDAPAIRRRGLASLWVPTAERRNESAPPPHSPRMMVAPPPYAPGRAAQTYAPRQQRREFPPPTWQLQPPNPGWKGRRFVSPDGNAWLAFWHSI
jgi:hypothetical protein